jgi:hypothetical protein
MLYHSTDPYWWHKYKALPKISGKSLVRKKEVTMSFRRESSESVGKVKLFT